VNARTISATTKPAAPVPTALANGDGGSFILAFMNGPERPSLITGRALAAISIRYPAAIRTTNQKKGLP
jgi:hypothetical protein